MKKLSTEDRKKQLEALAALGDENIDTSEIPELTDEQLARGVRGLMYRPVKRAVTMRIDADVLEWLKSAGPGYQTKANRILRLAMLQFRTSEQRRQVIPNAGDAAEGTVRLYEREEGLRTEVESHLPRTKLYGARREGDESQTPSSRTPGRRSDAA